MLVKKFSKHGNSMALVVDKPILEILGIDENTECLLTTNGDELTVKPIRYASRDKVQAAWRFIRENYDQTMQNLAK